MPKVSNVAVRKGLFVGRSKPHVGNLVIVRFRQMPEELRLKREISVVGISFRRGLMIGEAANRSWTVLNEWN
jgi:hypothetical protein